MASAELIETLWNVNWRAIWEDYETETELIETLWNVNICTRRSLMFLYKN